jgi:hypothetical protein
MPRRKGLSPTQRVMSECHRVPPRLPTLPRLLARDAAWHKRLQACQGAQQATVGPFDFHASALPARRLALKEAVT